MSCQQYQEELEVAAAGVLHCRSAEQFEAHLASCTACRAEFEVRKLMYEAVAEGLSRRVNEDLPLGFALRVRARVNANREACSKYAWWACPAVGAAAAMLIALVLMPGLRREQDRSGIEQTMRQDGPRPIERLGSGREESSSHVPSAPKSLMRGTRTRFGRPPVKGGERNAPAPEVLVPADQKVVVARLLDGLRIGEVEGDVLLVLGGDQNQELSIMPIAIPPIELNPLEEARPEPEPSFQ